MSVGKNGRLIVSAPESALGDGVGNQRPATRLLYAAEAVVVENLQAKKPLPDREVPPTGVLAPE